MADQLGHVSAQEADATYRRITRRLIPFLIVCYICAYVDRSNIGLAKLAFMTDLGFTEAVYGLAGGLFYLGYSLFEVPSNLVMSRIGARLTIARIMFLWSLFSAATAFMTSPHHFYILRFLLGAAEAGFFPGVLFYLSKWAPPHRRARMTALFMSSMALAGIIANPISGAITHGMQGVWGLAGWQWLFMIEGLPGCLLAVAAYVCLTDTPNEATWLTDRQKAIVVRDLEADEAAKLGSGHGSLADALKDPKFYVLALMSMAMISGLAGLSLWVPTIVRRAGIDNVFHIGVISALPYLCGVVVQQWIARSSDRRQERRWHAAAPALLGAAGWLSLPLVSGSTAGSIIAITCVGMGMFGATGPFWSLPANYLRGTAAAGGIALITTFGSIAGFFSPILVGWMTERSGSLAFGQYYFGFLLGAGALCLLASPKPSGRAPATTAAAAASN